MKHFQCIRKKQENIKDLVQYHLFRLKNTLEWLKLTLERLKSTLEWLRLTLARLRRTLARLKLTLERLKSTLEWLRLTPKVRSSQATNPRLEENLVRITRHLYYSISFPSWLPLFVPHEFLDQVCFKNRQLPCIIRCTWVSPVFWFWNQPGLYRVFMYVIKFLFNDGGIVKLHRVVLMSPNLKLFVSFMVWSCMSKHFQHPPGTAVVLILKQLYETVGTISF